MRAPDPLGAAGALFAIFLVGGRVRALRAAADTTIPSALIGQPVPDFALRRRSPGRPGLASADLRQGRPHLVNIFASWCLPCRAEAPQLAELTRRGMPVDGIAVRDRPRGPRRASSPPMAIRSSAIGADVDRQVQLALGSAGVPETFVVDGQRHHPPPAYRRDHRRRHGRASSPPTEAAR